jgi:hypothetical protein
MLFDIIFYDKILSFNAASSEFYRMSLSRYVLKHRYSFYCYVIFSFFFFSELCHVDFGIEVYLFFNKRKEIIIDGGHLITFKEIIIDGNHKIRKS